MHGLSQFLSIGAIFSLLCYCQKEPKNGVVSLQANWQIARKLYTPEALAPQDNWQEQPLATVIPTSLPQEEIWLYQKLPKTNTPNLYLLVGLTNPCEIFASGKLILTFGKLTIPPHWPGMGYFLEPIPPTAEDLTFRCLVTSKRLFLLAPRVGSYQALSFQILPQGIVQFSLSLLYFTLAVLTFVFYFVSPKSLKDIFYAYAAIFFSLIALFYFFSENIILTITWQAPFLIALAYHLTTFLLPVPWILMTNHLFKIQKPNWLLYLLALAHLTFSGIAFIITALSSRSLELFNPIFLVLFLISLITLLVTHIRHLTEKNLELIVFFIGTLILSIMVSIELVQLFSYPTKSDTSNTNYLYGLFLASLTIIFLTLQRLLIILKNQEEYSRKLEDKVQERTQSLNETLRKIQSELNTARKFQQKMLPDLYELQNLPLKTAARFLPMNVVGGDIYFITPLPNGKIRYFLADAAGHSIAAAIVTIAIKGEFEANSPSCPNPQQVLEILNSKFVAKYRSLNTFFSAVICDIDPKQNKLTFASAGHPTQFLNHQSQLILLKHTGPLIGIMDKVVYQQEEFPFIRGDNLLLFTDGILEQTKIENGKRYEFGEHRLAEIFAALSGSDAVDMADIIETELLRYAEGSPQEDDITFITVSY